MKGFLFTVCIALMAGPVWSIDQAASGEDIDKAKKIEPVDDQPDISDPVVEQTKEIEPQEELGFRSVLEYWYQGTDTMYSLGLGRAVTQENTPRNIGYVSIDYRDWGGWEYAQIGLKVDGFQNPRKPNQGAVFFRLFLYEETSSVQTRQGFGVGVAPSFQVLPGFFISPGATIRPFFTTFTWDTPYWMTAEWALEGYMFLGNNLALTGRYMELYGFQQAIPDQFARGWWWGVRLQF